MSGFTTEAEVRLKFQLADTVLVPVELVASSIDAAHEEVLRHLDGDVDTQSPEAALVTGETLLAGAHVFRSLASQDAATQRHVSIGGNQIHEGDRFAALMSVAEVAERQAWYLLEPYVADVPGRAPVDASAEAPVLGEA